MKGGMGGKDHLWVKWSNCSFVIRGACYPERYSMLKLFRVVD